MTRGIVAQAMRVFCQFGHGPPLHVDVSPDISPRPTPVCLSSFCNSKAPHANIASKRPIGYPNKLKIIFKFFKFSFKVDFKIFLSTISFTVLTFNSLKTFSYIKGLQINIHLLINRFILLDNMCNRRSYKFCMVWGLVWPSNWNHFVF